MPKKPSFYWPVLSQIAQNMILWRAGGTQKVWHHLSEFGQMAPSFNWPPIHTMKVYTFLSIGQTAACKVKNRLKAISHQKLATDGASPELIPTRTDGLQQYLHELAQLAQLAQAGPTHHCTRSREGGDSGNWELYVNQPNSAGILYNYLCILYITSNPSCPYTFNVNLAGF